MTNPIKKYSKDAFIQKVNDINGNIGITLLLKEDFNGVDSQVKFKCKHGENSSHGWRLLQKRKYCCSKGYHENRTPSLKKSLTERKKQYKELLGNDYIYDNLKRDPNKNGKFILECKKHGEFSQWGSSLLQSIGCPSCSKIKETERKKLQAITNFHTNQSIGNFVSKQETKWLDELEIPERQKYLTDVKYKVDGYDPKTNTVYLFHGRFWHGCPETYDPEYQHPILKIKMKELYEKTIMWENKIKDAGYNLIIEWG